MSRTDMIVAAKILHPGNKYDSGYGYKPAATGRQSRRHNLPKLLDKIINAR